MSARRMPRMMMSRPRRELSRYSISIARQDLPSDWMNGGQSPRRGSGADMGGWYQRPVAIGPLWRMERLFESRSWLVDWERARLPVRRALRAHRRPAPGHRAPDG